MTILITLDLNACKLENYNILISARMFYIFYSLEAQRTTMFYVFSEIYISLKSLIDNADKGSGWKI